MRHIDRILENLRFSNFPNQGTHAASRGEIAALLYSVTFSFLFSFASVAAIATTSNSDNQIYTTQDQNKAEAENTKTPEAGDGNTESLFRLPDRPI